MSDETKFVEGVSDYRDAIREIDRLTAALAAAERERDEARTTINLVREVVEEMRVDATRPKGGQSVSPRRMPVALSVVHELASLLGPEQAAYTHKAWMEEQAKLAAAERRAEEAERARDEFERRVDGMKEQVTGIKGELDDALKRAEVAESVAACVATDRDDATSDADRQAARAEAAEARLRECEALIARHINDPAFGDNEIPFDAETMRELRLRALRSPGDHTEDQP